MFESKDASKSDGRRVKNTPNAKPLTQKSKGETYTMGNRGTQLSVFFVISLMLIAGLFSNTAMAKDGDGRIAAELDTHTAILSDDADGTPAAFTASPLPTSLAAGSKLNALRLTYTAFTDVAASIGAPGTEDTANEVDDNDTAIDMANGRVRIAIPAGWTVPDKVMVIDYANGDAADQVVLYNSSMVANPTGATAPTDDSKARVTFKADSHIIVDLGPEWSATSRPTAATGNNAAAQGLVGRELQITFYEVTTPVPAGSYRFSSSSRTKNGSLRLLVDANQPSVAVGNIIGAKGGTALSTSASDAATASARDTRDREVTITPSEVFVGEMNHKFSISFTAPGPMDGGTLTIPIPDGLQPFGSAVSPIRPSGGASATQELQNGGSAIAADALATTRVDQIVVTLTTITQGQTVIVTYSLDEVLAAAAPVGFPTGGTGRGTIDIDTTVGTNADIPVNKVTGGKASTKAGSGKLEISPVSVSAGALRREINLTYTAATDLSTADYNIEITPRGIINPSDLQTDDSTAYGYVSGDEPDSLSVSSGVIKWTRVRIEKGKTLKAKIRRVDIVADPGNNKWDAKIGASPTTGDLATTDVIRTLPTLSVVTTADNPVRFEADNNTFPAGSMQTITFKFTAEKTPIRDGKVSFTIPSDLGSAPTAPKAEAAGQIKATVDNKFVSVAGRVVTVTIENMALGDSVSIEYGTTQEKGKQAVLGYMSGDYKVNGTFRASANTSTRSVDPVTIKLGKIGDGIGMTSKTVSPVTLAPIAVKAGSRASNAIEVVFTAAGTMDGGQVALEIPPNWGPMQDDPQKRNYVTTSPVPGSATISSVTIEANGRRAVATINKLGRGGSFKFIYGGGTVPASNGVEVQNDVGTADFMVLSDGNGDGVFAVVDSLFEQSGRQKILNPKKVGKILKGSAGVLKIEVTSAQDGTGEVTFEGDTTPVVRAADDSVQLVFIYTPTQTIQDGELKFTVPGGWSAPQTDNIGLKGYTEVGGAGLGSESTTGQSLTVPIFLLEKDQTIKITYGASGDATGRVNASTATGSAAFKFAVKGHEKGNLVPIAPVTLTVGPQASGKGKALITPMGDTLHAGDADREIKVVYTAAGQMVAGQVQLDIPTGWSAPTADSVTAMIDMTAATPTFTDQMIVVDGVSVLAGGTVTFVYTGTVQPTRADDVAFGVKSHGGLTTDSFAAVGGEETMLTVDVQEARAGSGTAMVEPKIVEAGATGVNLTFTYTAVGQIDPPREFRVEVPAPWTQPTNAATSADNKGTYTVEHRDSSGGLVTVSVEKLPPIGREMVARVRVGGLEMEAGDQIIFTYENADAPATPEVSPFQLTFSSTTVADSVQVRVQDSTPSMLSLQSAGTVSADEGEMLGITVGLADDDGDAVAMNSDATVTLTSTSTTGAFSMMADEAGTASATVTIAGGDVSAMVYYMDSTAGTATITATAPGLTMASQDVTVTAAAVDPTAVAITSVMVDPTLAMDGDTVTVTAMATAGQAPMVTIGSIVTDGVMVESPAGTYTRTDTLAAGTQEGTYSVSVSIGDVMESATDMLTIDNTDPEVTVTAPESAANGDTVMISATVTDASAISSVMADVSMLDSTQTDPVALTMGDDGYSASITISADNENANGSKTVTVTAMDAAGNSGMGEATVELKNTLSYTSMIPAGISLYHVPLDVADIETVGDLKMKLGDAASLVIVYDHATGSWNSRSDDVMITADLGVVLSMASATTLALEGEAWDDGASMISLSAGPNLVGLPVNDPRVTNVSDIAGLFDEGVVLTITVSTADGFELASDTMDPAVMGDAAYLVTASADATATLLGDGWSYSATGAAPIALAGYSVDGQTPVLDVQGAVVDEITGLAKEGFRVKVKNLSTKASLSKVTSVETAEGYNMTFVDLKAGNAARIGDILEISADSPSPLIGVQPVRHVVTADDVKSGILALENLIAYEIPAETELLRNYPNPFNPETWIPYHLAEDADVRLTIYSINGQVVRDIDVGHQTAAKYDSRSKAIYWDGRNRFGEQVASGIYFYSLSAGDFSATRKMVILK